MEKKTIALLIFLLSGYSYSRTTGTSFRFPSHNIAMADNEVSVELSRLSEEYGYVLYMAFYRIKEYRPIYDSIITEDISARTGRGHNEFTFTQLLSEKKKEDLLAMMATVIGSEMNEYAQKAVNRLTYWCIAFNQFENLKKLYNNDVESLVDIYSSSKTLKEKLIEIGLTYTRNEPESLTGAMVYFYHFEILDFISTLSEKRQLETYTDIYDYGAKNTK